jgi:hypothetical protein
LVLNLVASHLPSHELSPFSALCTLISRGLGVSPILTQRGIEHYHNL